MRVARVALVAGVLALSCWSGAAHAQQGLPTSDVTAFETPAVDARVVAEIVEARDAAEARQEWLAGPQARAERAQSRTRFRGRLGARAREIAANKFGALVTGPLWSPPELGAGERKAGMNGDRVMRVERDGEPVGVVDSMVPLQVTAADGSKVPTDTTLKTTADGFAPRAPVAPLSIGERLANGVSFEESGLVVTPVMDDPRAAGVLADDRVFYADAGTDTDVIVGATPTGAAIYYQLRSSESPDAMELELSLPEGAELRASRDGTGGAEVVRDGDVIAVIEAPYAVDAQGQSVPTRYRISGDRITVTADHNKGDYAYPVLLDPVVDQQLWTFDHSPVRGWFFLTPWQTHFFPSTGGGWGDGLYLSLGGGRYYGKHTWGEWRYPVPGTAHAYKVNFALERHAVDNAARPVCMTLGFRHSRTSAWDANTFWTGAFPTASGRGPRVRCNNFNGGLGSGTTMCLLGNCAVVDYHATGPNFPAVQQFTDTADYRHGFNLSYLGGAVVHLSDPEYPLITGGPATIATDPNATWDAFYSDPGLGLKRIIIDAPGNPDWQYNYDDTLNCAGTAWAPCIASSGRQLRYGNLPPGPQTLRVRAQDASGKVSTKDYTVNINYYATSLQYGGPDHSVNTWDEISELTAAMDGATASQADSLWSRLSPGDQAFVDNALRVGPPQIGDVTEAGTPDETEEPEAGASGPIDPVVDVNLGQCSDGRTIYPSQPPNWLRTSRMTLTHLRTATVNGVTYRKIEVDARVVEAWQTQARWAGVEWRALDPDDVKPETNAAGPFRTSTERDASRPNRKPWYFHASAWIRRGGVLRFRGEVHHDPVTVHQTPQVRVRLWGAHFPSKTRMFRCTVP